VDSEGKQGKGWLYLFKACKLRGALEPEICHPLWNPFKNAIDDVEGMKESALKLTHVCNYNHGSFKSGDRGFTKREIFADYLSKQPDEYYDMLQEEIASCLGIGNPEEAESLRWQFNEFMQAPCIAKRNIFAT
jgi:hypothetical protein